jgi:hypothetical protein
MQEIINRVKEIVLKPRETWEKISTEETSTAALMKNYLFVLAAVPAVASFLGRWIVGIPVLFKMHRYTFWESLITCLITYALTVACIWLLGKLISLIAPNFGSTRDDLKGLKVAVYSYTPFLAAGIFNLIPALNILVYIAGLYGLYLLYIGLPIVMGTPKEKSLPYTIVVLVAIFLVYIIIGSITIGILKAFGPSITIR